MHCSEEILLGGLTHGVLLIIGENDHIFPFIPELLIEICRHVFHVVDASSQLTALPKVVDTNEKCFPATCTVGVLEAVALRGAVTKSNHS